MTPNMSAFLSQLQEKPGEPEQGAREVMREIVSRSEDIVPLHELLYGMADGYGNSVACKSVCRIVGHLCKYLTPTGALIVLTVGIVQGLKYLTQATGAVLSRLGAVFGMLGNPLGTAAVAAAKWFSEFLNPVKKDGAAEAMVGVLTGMILADVPSPILAAIGAAGSGGGATITPAISGGGRSTAPSSMVRPSSSSSSPNEEDAALAAALTEGLVASLKGDGRRRVNSVAVMTDARRMLRDGRSPREVESTLNTKYSSRR